MTIPTEFGDAQEVCGCLPLHSMRRNGAHNGGKVDEGGLGL